MTRPAVAVVPVAANQKAPSKSSGLLQRKCACGGSAGFSGKCEDCTKDRPGVQRRAAGPATGIAPPIVHEVLRSPGQPLDPVTRGFMEPRFGHDFSKVRVHADQRAARSAHAVNAFAYTVGRDVVFASGRYAPYTSEGRKLLTHELVHTLQQPTSVAAGPLRVDAADSTLERAADRIAERAMTGRSIVSPASGGGRMVQRQSAPGQREQAKARASKEGGPKNRAGEKVKDEEQHVIDALIEKRGLPAEARLAKLMGTTFVLHDTAGLSSADTIKSEQTRGRGPLAKGTTAWAPRGAPAEMTRPSFFEARRPSTTVFEKALDLFAQNKDEASPPWTEAKIELLTARRNKLFREVWNAASPDSQTSALDAALPAEKNSPEKLSPIEKQQQIGGKKSGPDKTTGAIAQLSAKSGDIETAAGWAVEEICKGVGSPGWASATVPGQEEVLEGACKALGPYFAARKARLSSTVNVEILQSKEDTDIPDPPYTENQYTNVAEFYARAARVAGQFPSITTHYLLDAGHHYDPRCFNLHYLYGKIATTIGHPAGCTYGVEPSYGTTPITNNIWWTFAACHGDPPK